MSGALRARKSCRFLVYEVTNDCELPTRHWESNLGPLQEQQVLITAGLPLQAPNYKAIYKKIGTSICGLNRLQDRELNNH